jgi:DNA-binding transcriptional regulator YhcF (GntR family)
MAQEVNPLQVSLSAEEAERAALVDFSVDPDADLPLGTQLTWKIRSMIARGALRGDDRLPSVRELAEFSGINVNTARAVYRDLEAEGAIHSEHGRGTFVTEPEGDRQSIDALVRSTLEGARDRDVDLLSLAEAIWAAASAAAGAELSEPPHDRDPDLDAKTLRKELRQQIARIEREVAAYARHDRRERPPRRVPSAVPTARVASVEDLQRTRSELIDRLMHLRKEADRRGAAEQRARSHIEDMVDDPAAHRGEVVTIAEAGHSDRTTWRVVPRYGPLGAILGWWRVEARS